MDRTEVEAGDRFEQVMPYGRDTVEVEHHIDAERVAVVRANGARQVFPVSTLLNERYWRRSPQGEYPRGTTSPCTPYPETGRLGRALLSWAGLEADDGQD